MSNGTEKSPTVLELLERFIERAETLLADRELSKGKILIWTVGLNSHLGKIYGTDSELLAGFRRLNPNSPIPDLRAEIQTRHAHLRQLVSSLKDLPSSASANPSKRVFIGHGRSPMWRELKDFIHDRLDLEWDEFNREAVAGLATSERLEQMLRDAAFAFLIMTAEEEHADSSVHARPNVIHEIGLFQGRLGFRKAVVLLEEGCAEFSNIVGLTQIRFPRNEISSRFEDIRRVLERESLA